MLAISTWFTKDDGSSLNTFVKPDASLGDRLAVALHVQLLYVGRELKQGLAVGKDGSGGKAADVGVVEADQAQEHGQVLGEVGRVPEVLVHGVGALEESLDYGEAVVEGEGEHSYCRRH